MASALTSNGLRLETLVTGAFVENGYVLSREDSDKCVVVDPGAEPERWVAWFEDQGLTPEAVLGTHCHLDHVGAVEALRDAFGARYLIHEDEQGMLDMLPMQCRMFGYPEPQQPVVDAHVVDDEGLTVAGIDVEVIGTPGHTPGGSSFHVSAWGDAGLVFTGDSLFAGSIGRTDLPGGETQRLLDSLHALLARLPDDCLVLPGHGPSSTIKAERDGNPFLKPGALGGF